MPLQVAVDKIAFTSLDDKRYQLCSIHSCPYGSVLVEYSKKYLSCYFCDPEKKPLPNEPPAASLPRSPSPSLLPRREDPDVGDDDGDEDGDGGGDDDDDNLWRFDPPTRRQPAALHTSYIDAEQEESDSSVQTDFEEDADDEDEDDHDHRRTRRGRIIER